MKPQASIRHRAGSPAARERSDGLRADGEGGTVYRRLLKSRRVKWLEAVSNPEDRLDVLVRVLTQFLTQPPDVYIQGAGPDVGSVTPDLHEQRFPGNDFSGVLHEQRQQIVLLARQGQRTAVEHRQLLAKIQKQMLVVVRRPRVALVLKQSHIILRILAMLRVPGRKVIAKL